MAIVALCSRPGGPIAVLDAAAFRLAFPAFASLTDPQLAEMFSLATIYLRNDGTSPVRTVALQTTLLYQLTAHLAQMTYGANGTGASGIVGRINSASEGSVSVGVDWPSTANNAWFLQTTYGANFWQATAAHRMVNYVPGPARFGTGIGVGYLPGGPRRRF